MFVCILPLGMLLTTSFRLAMVAQPVQQHALSKKLIQRHATFASVNISGPLSLSMCDQGTWTASVSGAGNSFTYEWYLTVPGNGTEPAVTHYVSGSDMFVTYLDYWITYPDRSSVSLQVDVYNANGYVGSGYWSVYAYPCF